MKGYKSIENFKNLEIKLQYVIERNKILHDNLIEVNYEYWQLLKKYNQIINENNEFRKQRSDILSKLLK